jgi:hypothetical protein
MKGLQRKIVPPTCSASLCSTAISLSQFYGANPLWIAPSSSTVRRIDFLSVLNNLITVTADGLLSARNSESPAHVTQLSGHLNW